MDCEWYINWGNVGTEVKKKSQRINILSDEKHNANFEVKDAIFRAPPWARLLQEEWEVETRRRLDNF